MILIVKILKLLAIIYVTGNVQVLLMERVKLLA